MNPSRRPRNSRLRRPVPRNAGSAVRKPAMPKPAGNVQERVSGEKKPAERTPAEKERTAAERLALREKLDAMKKRLQNAFARYLHENHLQLRHNAVDHYVIELTRHGSNVAAIKMTKREDFVEIDRLYVVPEHRSKGAGGREGLGFGTVLVKAAELFAQVNHINCVALDASKLDPKGKHSYYFYKQLGYRPLDLSEYVAENLLLAFNPNDPPSVRMVKYFNEPRYFESEEGRIPESND